MRARLPRSFHSRPAPRDFPTFVGAGYRYSSRPGSSAKYIFNVKQAGRYQVRIAYNAHPNRSPQALVIVAAGGRQFESRINQKNPPPIAGQFISVGTFEFKPGRLVVV